MKIDIEDRSRIYEYTKTNNYNMYKVNKKKSSRRKHSTIHNAETVLSTTSPLPPTYKSDDVSCIQ